MKRASQLFSDEQKRRVAQAVAEAEGRTAAEIVPVVVVSSGRYDRAEDIFGVLLGLAAMIAADLLLPAAPAEHGSWGGMPPALRLLIQALAVVTGFIAGAALATRIGWLRRLFIPRSQMRDEVEARARAVFFDSRVHHTAAKSGLLVYVSLQERMAAVLADKGAMAELGALAVERLRDGLIEQLRKGDVIDALCRTVRTAGEELAAVLPSATENVNELSDALVVLE